MIPVKPLPCCSHSPQPLRLSVLDQPPVAEGSSLGEALERSVNLAQQTEIVDSPYVDSPYTVQRKLQAMASALQLDELW